MMKTLNLISVLIMLLAGSFCSAQVSTTTDDSLTSYYNIEIPKKGGEYSGHRTVFLEADKSIHKLNFGTFTTESTIEIFTDDSTNRLLIKQHLEPDQKQIVDISKLSKGIYKIHFTAIAESCVFQLEIK